MSTTLKYPTARDLLINLPLYEIVNFEANDLEVGRQLYYYNETLDTYCPKCNKHSIFSRYWPYSKSISYLDDSWVDEGKFAIELQCSRDSSHRLYFLFIAEGQSIQKIGQYPSLADLSLYDIQKYSKALDRKYFQEFTKAIGLASHGIGVGSFVYLRRIFEFLIDEAHQQSKESEDWDENLYLKSRMSEKISLLRTKLPEFLIDNSALYSILSKGLHELGEDECLAAFPVVKLGIEIILDDKLEKSRKEKKLLEAKKTIANLNSKI